MIVDVTNLDTSALACYITYLASAIAQSRRYGISCNIEHFLSELCKASRYYWLTQNCVENLTDNEFCQIDEYIRDVKVTNIYNIKSQGTCLQGLTELICGLSTEDNSSASACTSTLTINIVQ